VIHDRAVLTALTWRGNVTELREILERLLADAAGDVIGLEDVLKHARVDTRVAPEGGSPGGETITGGR
jgi:DNA-binding NtrC family response regulator